MITLTRGCYLQEVLWQERSHGEENGKGLSSYGSDLPYCTLRQKRPLNPICSGVLSTPNPWAHDSPSSNSSTVGHTRASMAAVTKSDGHQDVSMELPHRPLGSCCKAPSESQLKSLTLPGPAKFRLQSDTPHCSFNFQHKSGDQQQNRLPVSSSSGVEYHTKSNSLSTNCHDNRRQGSSGYHSDDVTGGTVKCLSTFSARPLSARHSVDSENDEKSCTQTFSDSPSDVLHGTTVLRNVGILRNKAGDQTIPKANPPKHLQTRYSTSTVIV